MSHKTIAWLQILGLVLAQVIADGLRTLWEKNSPYLGILTDPKWFAADVVYAVALLTLVYYVYKRVNPENNYLTNSGVAQSLKKLGSGFAAGFFLQSFLILLLLVFCQIVLGGDVTIMVREKLLSVLPAIFDAAYIGAFEEILFRGLLLAELCKVTRPVIALLIQAGIFALFHLDQAQSSVFFILSLFIVGWVLGFVTIKQRTLWSVIGAHVAWNFLAVAILGTPLSIELLPPLVHLSGLDESSYATAQTFHASIEIVTFGLLLLWIVLMRRGKLF